MAALNRRLISSLTGSAQGLGRSLRRQPGDLLLVLAGEANATRKALGELRLEMGKRLELRDPNKFACLWVVDFPLLEWDEEAQRFFAMHHPFTSPLLPEDIELLSTDPGQGTCQCLRLW
jgi:aspartyl-tRNA synthetase